VAGEVVVAGFGSGELAALRASDGRQIWGETLSSARGGGISDIAAIGAMPIIDRGRVFAAGLGGLVIAADLPPRCRWGQGSGARPSSALVGIWVGQSPANGGSMTGGSVIGSAMSWSHALAQPLRDRIRRITPNCRASCQSTAAARAHAFTVRSRA
jgi:hypothetical protein